MAGREENPRYRVVAAVGAESQLRPLLAVACGLAAAKDGQVEIMTVTAGGQPPDWLRIDGERDSQERAQPAACGEVPVDVVTLTGPEPGREILAALNRDPPDLILLAWGGERGTGRYLLGATLDPVVQQAPCDVAVVRVDDTKSMHRSLSMVKAVLVPASGGPNASLAIDLALSLSPGVQVTVLNVARAAQGQVALSLSEERLAEILEPWAGEARVQGKVVQASSVVRGILDEAAQGFDLVLVGASHESYLDRMLFGNIPQTVAARCPVPAVVVRRDSAQMRVGTWLRRLGWRLFDVLPTLDLREQIEVYKTIRTGAAPGIDFYVMIALSAAIATIGLLQSSPAVIIGAMLVAPLMAAIFGISLGVVRGDLHLLRRAVAATLQGVILTMAVALILAFLAPAQPLADEITNRTQPSLMDLGVALASGAAGAYALCRKGVSAALPGVAIAAALVPPLAVAGIGLAMWDGTIAVGALLLFSTNLVAIVAAGGLVFLWLGFRPLPGRESRTRVFQRGVLGTVVMLAAVTGTLGLLTARTLREATMDRAIRQALRSELQTLERVEWDGEWTTDTLDDGTLQLDIVVRSARTITHPEVVDLQERLASNLDRPVALLLSVIPATRLNSLAPPTPTPTGTPTALPGATLAPTPGLMGSPTPP